MIFINDIPSFRDPEDYEVTPDDRIEKIEIIGSVAYQDYGHVADGDVFALTCLFSPANFNRLVNLWETRATVSYTDTAGIVHPNLFIVIRNYKLDKDFPTYIFVTFELWRKK